MVVGIFRGVTGLAMPTGCGQNRSAPDERLQCFTRPDPPMDGAARGRSLPTPKSPRARPCPGLRRLGPRFPAAKLCSCANPAKC